MKNLKSGFKLNNGIEIPCVGFGTWQVANGKEAYVAVIEALKAGYRHIDTAAAYENERSVGKAIKDSKINREDIFITTKLPNPMHGYENTMKAFKKSLEALDLEYIDLYLIHWPNPIMYRDNWQEANAESWKAMEELYLEGKIRSIGVSNFLPHHLEELKKTAKITPMVNQIKLFPGLKDQQETIEYCHSHKILLSAYSPFGTGRIFEAPEIIELGEKYQKTMAQICLRWSIQKGYVPLPKSVTPQRIKDNTHIFDFEISNEDMKKLDNMPNYCGDSKNPDQTTF